MRDELIQLLLTNPGERPFLPEFGGGVRRLVFEAPATTTAAMTKAMISQALSRWLGHRAHRRRARRRAPSDTTLTVDLTVPHRRRRRPAAVQLPAERRLMTAIVDQDALDRPRRRNLGTLNGIDFVLVDLEPAGSPDRGPARAALLQHERARRHPRRRRAPRRGARQIFPIAGGHRVPRRARRRPGADDGRRRGRRRRTILVLTVEPIGDYSTYTLRSSRTRTSTRSSADVGFKFRPGCFTHRLRARLVPPPTRRCPRRRSTTSPRTTTRSATR